jgi:beta-lactamase class A
MKLKNNLSCFLQVARISFLCLAIASISVGPLHAQQDKLYAVIPAVQQRIQQSGADVAVALESLDGKASWFLRADEPFHAASTMKIPVMIELYHQLRQGKIRLEDTLVIRNEFHSIVDGSVYKLDAATDSEPGIYKAEGEKRTLAGLCELMITVSSNLATNLLIEKLGTENIKASVESLHADGMKFLRGVEDGKAYEKGLSNTTTARGLLVLLQAIARGQAVDSAASGQMVEILKRQKFNEAIPAGLPPDTVVAHKTGEITKIHHDAAIVYAPRPFVLVLLVRGVQDSKQSAALMADITALLYPATQ